MAPFQFSNHKTNHFHKIWQIIKDILYIQKPFLRDWFDKIYLKKEMVLKRSQIDFKAFFIQGVFLSAKLFEIAFRHK